MYLIGECGAKARARILVNYGVCLLHIDIRITFQHAIFRDSVYFFMIIPVCIRQVENIHIFGTYEFYVQYRLTPVIKKPMNTVCKTVFIRTFFFSHAFFPSMYKSCRELLPLRNCPQIPFLEFHFTQY